MGILERINKYLIIQYLIIQYLIIQYLNIVVYQRDFFTFIFGPARDLREEFGS